MFLAEPIHPEKTTRFIDGLIILCTFSFFIVLFLEFRGSENPQEKALKILGWKPFEEISSRMEKITKLYQEKGFWDIYPKAFNAMRDPSVIEEEALAMRAFFFGLAFQPEVADNIRQTALGFFLNQVQNKKEDFFFYIRITHALDKNYPKWRIPILEEEWNMLGRKIMLDQGGLLPIPLDLKALPGGGDFFSLRPDLLEYAQNLRPPPVSEARPPTPEELAQREKGEQPPRKEGAEDSLPSSPMESRADVESERKLNPPASEPGKLAPTDSEVVSKNAKKKVTPMKKVPVSAETVSNGKVPKKEKRKK